jgi:hypothetical protein
MHAEFPKAIDNTMLSDYKSCSQKFAYRHIFGRNTVLESIHLSFGSAYADGCEAARLAFWGQNHTPEESISIGVRKILSHSYPGDLDEFEKKSLFRCVHAMVSMFEKYGFADDPLQPVMLPSGPALEFSFAIPFPIPHPETGDPLLYTGRYDMWGTFSDYEVLMDDKSASRGGDQWDKKWDLRAQFLGYLWGHRQYRKSIKSVLIRSPILLQNELKLLQTLKHYDEYLIEDWYHSTLYFINKMIEDWKHKLFHRVYDDSCTSYFGCDYRQVCSSPRFMEQRNLDTNFPEISFWRPMERKIEIIPLGETA